MAKYTLNIEGKLRVNTSELDKLTRQVNRVFAGKGGKSVELFTGEQKALRQIEALLRRVRSQTDKLSPDITKSLRGRISGLTKLINSDDVNKLDKFRIRLDSIKSALSEVTDETKKLTAAQKAQQKAQEKLANLRVGQAGAGNIAVTKAISKETRDRAKALKASISERLNAEVAAEQELERQRVQQANRGNTAQTASIDALDNKRIKQLRKSIQARLEAEVAAEEELAKQKQAQATKSNEAANKEEDKQTRKRTSKLRNDIRTRLEAEVKAEREIAAQRLEQAAQTNESLTQSADQQRAAQAAALRSNIEARAERQDRTNRLRRLRTAKQDRRTEQQELVRERLRNLSDTIQKSSISPQDQQRLLTPFASVDSTTNSKAGRKRANRFIKDTQREAKELVDAQKELEKREREVEQRRNRAQKAKARRLKEQEANGAFGFGRQSALAFRRFTAFTVAASAAFEVQAAFRAAVGEAIAFQDQMVRIGQVTGRSAANLDELKTKITEVSTTFGTSSAELANSALIIAQAGFSLNETKDTLETLAKAQLTPSFNNLDNTTEGLIALRSQFGITASEFESTLGSINAVSKAFAVESEDIITALRKTGGAFNVAGGNVNELIALFTAVRSSTRESADTIAVGFRTIFGRLQRPAVIEELRKFNIELQDTSGNFVGPLKAIAALNRGLSQVGQGNPQFARIVEQVGGIRQISKVVPLIREFATAQTALNVAKLGTNSLDEDAAKRQEAIQTQINKTKEAFLAFTRSLGDQNTVLGKAFRFVNENIQDLLSNLNSLSGFATPLGFLVGAGALGSAGKFASGFASNLNLVGGSRNRGTLIQASRKAFGQNAKILGRTDFPLSTRLGAINKNLGGSLGILGGAAAAGGLFLGGRSLANVGALNQDNKNRFALGTGLQEGASGLTTGAVAGSLVGGVPGAVVGAALGALVFTINGFVDAVKLAEQQIAQSKFNTVFNDFSETVSLVNSGQIAAIGSTGGLQGTISAIQERKFTATGVFRDQLEGDTKQLVEKLLTFNQKLAEGVTTFEEFNAVGGKTIVDFIAANSVLKADELNQSVQDIIDANANAKQLADTANKINEQLLAQANLLNAFANALSDATDASEKIASSFDFAAQTFSGGTGFTFSGRAGFNNVFDRPGRIGNIKQFGAASSQLEGLLGGALPGLAQSNVAGAELFNQLPAILSQFALSRPSGNINDSIDQFIRQRLETIAGPAAQGALEPVIDAIVASISAEAGGEGGQAKLINKILENTVEFTQELIDKSGAEAGRKFQQEAANSIISIFNRFAGQLQVVTDREIDLRQQIVESELTLASQNAELEVLRDPRGRLRPDLIAAANTQQQQNLLANNPFGQALVDNPKLLATAINGATKQILEIERALQKANTVEEFEGLGKQLSSAQQNLAALQLSFKLATDTTARRAAIEQKLADAQLAREQINQGAGNFVFGNRQQRNQLNAGAALTQLVAGGGPNAFRQIANFPGDQDRQLPGVLDGFLQQFSKVVLPVFTGNDARGKPQFENIQLEELRRRIIEEELFGVFQQQIGAQFAPRDRKKNQGIIDAQARQAAQVGAGQAISTPEQELIDELQALNKADFENRELMLKAMADQNKALTDSLGDNLRVFIAELRNNILLQERQVEQNKARQQVADEHKLNLDFNDLVDVVRLGGSRDNQFNPVGVAFAKRLRDIGTSPEDEQRTSDIAKQNIEFTKNARVVRLSEGFNRFQQNIQAQGVDTAATTLGRLVGGDLSDQAIERIVSKEVAEFQESQNNILPALREDPSLLYKDIVNRVSEAIIAENTTKAGTRQQILADVDAAGPDTKAFVANLEGLSKIDFERIAGIVNRLGNVSIDGLDTKINEIINNNKATLQRIQEIDAQIKQNTQQAQPQALNDAAQQFNQGVNGFVGQSAALVASMDNFPRTVDLTANHNVNVTFNGLQVLQTLTPTMQEIAVAAANDAISKFVKDKLPGAGALS